MFDFLAKFNWVEVGLLELFVLLVINFELGLFLFELIIYFADLWLAQMLSWYFEHGYVFCNIGILFVALKVFKHEIKDWVDNFAVTSQ